MFKEELTTKSTTNVKLYFLVLIQSQPIQRPLKMIRFHLRCQPKHAKAMTTVICHQPIRALSNAREMKTIPLSQPGGPRKEHCRLSRMALTTHAMNSSKREIPIRSTTNGDRLHHRRNQAGAANTFRHKMLRRTN